MFKKFWIEILVVAAIGVIASFAFANAASLRVCFDGASVTADTARVTALANASPLFEDVLRNSTAQSVCIGGPVHGEPCTAPSTCGGGTCVSKRCDTQPIPASLARGQDVAITLRAFNAYGEGGPASAPVSFRSPALPPQVTGATVSIVVP
jgi:hypothetical protein